MKCVNEGLFACTGLIFCNLQQINGTSSSTSTTKSSPEETSTTTQYLNNTDSLTLCESDLSKITVYGQRCKVNYLTMPKFGFVDPNHLW